ncbi:endonuclease/exonuclease/phosphatase family protein [Nocardioides coralli]|uniref:endonuclease/exonuclease/phosphatase family protein n=1 Tax=Nocardioides coralli TaxID=2872154 RepID=UPI001CA3C9C5|nr:endonuclease/exonuclease/phosphatase family protein [Nocardioides coralli]QZY29401.1 endonuclease/exonuclease/phosphatase family protein [Nocardioides coralli]
MLVRIACFNVENLFARPTAFDAATHAEGEQVLADYREFNALIAKPVYDAADRARLRELLVGLGIYYVNTHGAVRRSTARPRWAWLRKNRGSFDSQPNDSTRDVEIVASGRGSWIGWAELATEAVDEVGTRMTARVIADVDADILAIVEAEDRPALLRLNHELLADRYHHLMLVDGNDERGIDVGILTKRGFPIRWIRSQVDAEDDVGIVFSRDCCEYEVGTPTGAVVKVLVNHFKSQSGGGDDKRRRQAERVRSIVDDRVADGDRVIVLGDLNEGPPEEGAVPDNLAALFDPAGPLTSCFDLPGFDVGERPGTYAPCSLRDRLDYVLLSTSLLPAFESGWVYRKGVWGDRKTRPTAWETYPEMTESVHQASDHAAVVVELDL